MINLRRVNFLNTLLLSEESIIYIKCPPEEFTSLHNKPLQKRTWIAGSWRLVARYRTANAGLLKIVHIFPCLRVDRQAFVQGKVSMTSRDSHCTWHSHLVNLWQARSPGFVPRDLAKASIVHVTPSDPMTRIVHQGTNRNPCPTFPFPKYPL